MRKNSRFFRTALAASLTLAFGSHVHALPAGGAVSAGSASIVGTPARVTVNQSSQNVSINWQSFSIGAAEAVQFVQPGSSAVALNRVVGQEASSILGSLSANGKVFLVNPHGILFGQGAQVNVGALVASTRDITDSDFMAGNYKFTGSSTGAIVNQGSINAPGGYVALLGANVSNEGVISARLGTVALAAGNAMTLDVAGDGLLNVVVNEGAVNALAQNGGLIRADGGQVLLSASSAGNLLQSAVNNTGVIQAQSIENRNGTIRLLGDMQSGTVSVGGTLDASGMAAGQRGGSVTVTGHHVGLFGGRINASGDAGGGTVLVGGGFQGNNPAVPNASATYMSADASISADAITHGNGGTVVLWANDSTRAYGTITARGGAQAGDGGLIETSAHWLDTGGIRVNASAPHGASGTWLLDPADVTISAAVTSGATNTANVFSPDTGTNASNVNTTDLRNALEVGTGTNITITTTNAGVAGTPSSIAPNSGLGDITIVSALTFTPGVSATLTLNAGGDVNINAAVNMTRGNLVVCCGRDINVRAAVTAAGGGSVLFTAGRDIRVERTLVNPATDITVTNGNIAMCAGRDLILDNTFNGAALITLNDSGVGPLSLGLTPGITLSAGNNGTGPGAAAGTVRFTPTTKIALTRAAAPALDANIFYNPVSYAAIDRTDFGPLFTLVGAVNVNTRMLVFPGGADRPDNGTTTATFTGLKGIFPAGLDVSLTGAGAANFDDALPGLNKNISFAGFGLGGADAGLFALPGSAVCCAPAVQRTTGNILAALVVVPPVAVAPAIVAPAVALQAAPVALQTVMPDLAGPFVAAPSAVPGLMNFSVMSREAPPMLMTLAQPVEPRPVVQQVREEPPVVVAPAAPPPPPPVFVRPMLPPKPDRN